MAYVARALHAICERTGILIESPPEPIGTVWIDDLVGMALSEQADR